jgi:stage II sporulation SpoE-like protein
MHVEAPFATHLAGATVRRGAVVGAHPILRLLPELNAVGPGDLTATLLAALEPSIGALDVRLLIADMEEQHLDVRAELQANQGSIHGSADMHGSVQGEVYRTGETRSTSVDGQPTIIAPVTARGDRAGVIEVRVKDDPDDGSIRICQDVGVLVGYLITAADRWTDEFHFARRRREMSLPAEIQWSQLPLAAFSSREIAIAGALEPAYDVGGDSFDYACGMGVMAAGIFDAMGHGLTAARLSAFGVATYRNARRRGDGLEGQARAIHGSLRDCFEREGYMTGQVWSIDLLAPENTTVVCAGHPHPILQHRSTTPELRPLEGGLPFGVPFDNVLRAERFPLEPGDRLTMFSDGILDARPDEGEEFGLESLRSVLVETRSASPREAARRIIQAVRLHRAADLVDDATVLIVDIPSTGA